MEGEPVSGGTIDLLSADRQFLGRASYSPSSQIRARVWSFDEESIDTEFFRKRIRSSLTTRHSLEIEKTLQCSAIDLRRVRWHPGLDRGPLWGCACPSISDSGV